MDRSRVSSAIPGARFMRSVDDLVAARDEAPASTRAADIDVVVIDLARYLDAVGAIRATLPGATLIGFAPHVDGHARDESRSGTDVVMPRSKFFHDVRAAVGYS